MAQQHTLLTGIWQGLYSYPAYLEPVYFVATLISSGSGLSGATHEAVTGRSGAPLTLLATLSGSVAGQAVTFSKTYDGTAGWNHSIAYDGTLNGEKSEIEGAWTIHGVWSGRFLMIRAAGADEKAVRKAYMRV